MHRTEGVDYTTEEGKRRYIDPNLPSVRGTILNAESMNALQEEICNVIEKAGLTLNATASADRADGWDQLWAAITASGIIGTNALSNNAVTSIKALSSTNQTALHAGGYENGASGVARASFHIGESTESTGIHSVGRPHTTGNTLPRPSFSPNGSVKYAGKYYMQGIVLSAYHSAYLEASEIDGTSVQDDVEVFIGLGVYDGLDMSQYERCYHVWCRSKHVANGTPDQLSWVCVQANDSINYNESTAYLEGPTANVAVSIQDDTGIVTLDDSNYLNNAMHTLYVGDTTDHYVNKEWTITLDPPPSHIRVIYVRVKGLITNTPAVDSFRVNIKFPDYYESGALSTVSTELQWFHVNYTHTPTIKFVKKDSYWAQA